MVPRQSYPPIRYHPALTTLISPQIAQKNLAAYLARTPLHPHLHPDALLSAAGAAFSAQSGPIGGLAIHHLKRIEAGLRGENLIAESKEEVAELLGLELPAGDDAKVDQQIEGTALKRKRRDEDVASWAEQSSEAGVGFGVPVIAPEWEGAEEQEEYELNQRPMVGEVSKREAGGAVLRQNGLPPSIMQHDGSGRIVGADGGIDKRARKAAKKARHAAIKVERAED